jgi:alpha-1,3/alpha-1,6-mannosyltransferase
MLAGTPVLAANTGGPLETVVDGVTGWLCPPEDVEAWTVVMNKVLHKMSNADLEKMSEAGRQRVMNEFSDVKMAERLENIIDNISNFQRQPAASLSTVLAILSTIPLLAILAIVSLWKLYGS